MERLAGRCNVTVAPGIMVMVLGIGALHGFRHRCIAHENTFLQVPLQHIVYYTHAQLWIFFSFHFFVSRCINTVLRLDDRLTECGTRELWLCSSWCRVQK